MGTQIDKKAAKKSKQHTRYYNAAGKQVPGVTTITGVMAKPALKFWANNLGLEGIKIQDYVDDLAESGKCAHAMIEQHILNYLNLTDDEADTSEYSQDQIDRAENSFLKYLEWEKGQDLQYVAAEKKVVHEGMQYGGTADIVAYWGGVLYLLDIKTSKAIYEDMFTQLAGYFDALHHNGYSVEHATIVRVGRDETEGFEIKTCSGDLLDLHSERFDVCRELYTVNSKIKKESKKEQ